MNIPDKWDCDIVSDSFTSVEKEKIEQLIPTAQFVEATHTSTYVDGEHKRIAAIQVTFKVESRISGSQLKRVEDETGLELHSLRWDKNRAYLV